MNMLFQKTFITLLMSLSKPIALFTAFFKGFSISKKSPSSHKRMDMNGAIQNNYMVEGETPSNNTIEKTSNEKLHDNNSFSKQSVSSSSYDETKDPRDWAPSTPLESHVVFSDMAMISFHICMAFMIVTPVFLIAGIIFFVFGYIVWKTNLVYSDAVRYESGGRYWTGLCHHVLIGLHFSQLFLLITLMINGQFVLSVLMLPLIIATLLTIRNFPKVFDRKCEFKASCSEDGSDDQVRKLLLDLDTKQLELMMKISEQHHSRSTQMSSPLPSSPISSTESLFSLNSITDSNNVSARFNSVPVNFDLPDAPIPVIPWDADPQAASDPYADPMLLERSQRIILPPLLLPLVHWLRTQRFQISLDSLKISTGRYTLTQPAANSSTGSL